MGPRSTPRVRPRLSYLLVTGLLSIAFLTFVLNAADGRTREEPTTTILCMEITFIQRRMVGLPA